MKLKSLFVLAALGAASLATSANAASYIVTYTGTVGNFPNPAVDGANLFGGGSLAGNAFTATFLVNPVVASYHPGDVHYQTISGNGANNPLTGSLTINGHTVGLLNNLSGSQTLLYWPGGADPNRPNNGIYDTVDGNDGNRIAPFVSNENGNPIIAAGFTTPFTYTVQGGDNPFGGFEFYRAGVGVSGGELNTQTVSLAPVPEPATWAMLLLGFFGVGFMMRGARRRNAVTVA